MFDGFYKSSRYEVIIKVLVTAKVPTIMVVMCLNDPQELMPCASRLVLCAFLAAILA